MVLGVTAAKKPQPTQKITMNWWKSEQFWFALRVAKIFKEFNG
jgi:hypothetical protein